VMDLVTEMAALRTGRAGDMNGPEVERGLAPHIAL
jgi:hypothetical protein